MKNKYIIPIAAGVLFVGVVIAAAVVVKNNKNMNNGGGESEQDVESVVVEDGEMAVDEIVDDSIYSSDGVDIDSIGVEVINGTPTFKVIFSNNNGVNMEYDCSLFELSFEDGAIIAPASGTKTLAANESDIQLAFGFEKDDLKAGDKVSVLYNGIAIGDVEIIESQESSSESDVESSEDHSSESDAESAATE